MLSFFVQIGPKGAKVYHAGDVVGDTIEDKTEFERPDMPKRPRFDWEAKRVAD